MKPRSGPIFAITIALGLIGAGRDWVDRWITQTDMPSLHFEVSREVRDRNGVLLRPYTVGNGLWRMQTSMQDVDPKFLRMLIAYEDKRFYQHAGVDPLAMLRAGVQAIRRGKIVSGASTLTMQVARLLEDGTTGELEGKLRQVRVALALEQRLTKQEILDLYLTLAPYGGNLEGVRAASLRYFGKPPKRLSVAEAALLVSLPQAPNARRPDRYPAQAQSGAQQVLARLEVSGKTDTIIAKYYDFPRIAAHLTDRITTEYPTHSTHDLTIDAALQKRLEHYVHDVSAEFGSRMSIAMVVLDHTTGELVASIGAPEQSNNQRLGYVDMTRAIRSPGSTLKPLIYGMGFDAGLIHPNTIFADQLVSYDGYEPRNFDGEFRGDLTIRQTLQLSLNSSAVALTSALGPHRLVGELKRSGVQAVLPDGRAGLAVALGGIGANLHDLVGLYGAIANEGVYRPTRVQLGLPSSEETQRILTTKAAWYVTDILRHIPPPQNAPYGKIAFKTGTSYGHRDTWAIGYDGQHVIGVWMGRPDGTPMPGKFGADTAAPILFQAFGRLKPQPTPLPPSPPNINLSKVVELPVQLRRFKNGKDTKIGSNAPQIAFPPNGATVATSPILTAKLRKGVPPFQWVLNGMPIKDSTYKTYIDLKELERGFHDLLVIDATGQSARSSIELR